MCWLCPWWWWRCRRRRHTRRGGRGGRGARAARAAGAWRVLSRRQCAEHCVHAAARSKYRRESRERAVQQTNWFIRGAVTQPRQAELNADTVCCRPSWGFLPFSLGGRARTLCSRSTTLAHAAASCTRHRHRSRTHALNPMTLRSSHLAHRNSWNGRWCPEMWASVTPLLRVGRPPAMARL